MRVPNWECLDSTMTRIVRARDAFWHKCKAEKPYNETIVWLCTENKGIAGTHTGTKVTGRFGPGSANIKPD
jgi:hypothetical protein